MVSFVQDGSTAARRPEPRLCDFFYLEDFGFNEKADDNTAAVTNAIDYSSATSTALVVRPRHLHLLPEDRIEVVATLPDLFRQMHPETGHIVRVK